VSPHLLPFSSFDPLFSQRWTADNHSVLQPSPVDGSPSLCSRVWRERGAGLSHGDSRGTHPLDPRLESQTRSQRRLSRSFPAFPLIVFKLYAFVNNLPRYSHPTPCFSYSVLASAAPLPLFPALKKERSLSEESLWIIDSIDSESMIDRAQLMKGKNAPKSSTERVSVEIYHPPDATVDQGHGGHHVGL
jgi:hypothetical protein